MAGVIPAKSEVNTYRIVQAIRDLFAGRSNAVGTIELTANSATTDVTAINCGADSRVFLFPSSAAAATELGAGGMYVSSVSSGAFTITHANSATTGRTFYWVALG